MDDLKTVNITVAGRTFPVKVTSAEETVVRALEIDLNEKISEFQNTYPMRDKLDYVIMTMLTYTFDLKKSSTTVDYQDVTEKIANINTLLGDID
jgi:cell division protein ZapA (FtsZ GTPase activity inhibitor)